MKHLLKNAAILVALVLTVAFTGCKNPSSNDNGNSKSKLEAPTDLKINSIEEGLLPNEFEVNITFTYNGKIGLGGAAYAMLG